MTTVRNDDPPAAEAVELLWPGQPAQNTLLSTTGKSGGAGEIFTLPMHPGFVAKIYHPTTPLQQLRAYQRKIEWMMQHVPELSPVAPEHPDIVQLAWPQVMAQRKGKFCGFLMQKVAFDRTLELDYLLNRRQAIREGFDPDFGKLLTICCNLASVISCLHSARIAIVDLKPMNVKVYKSELYVAILDCDGFHIDADGFRADAPQVTPEYLAPEFHERSITHAEQQDRFALATIIFRLLNYGIHPFAGISARSKTAPTDLAGRIRQRLYPYALTPDPTLRPVPASIHFALPDDIRERFDQAFGGPPASRPSAADWVATLSEYAHRRSTRLQRCQSGHLQFVGKPCASCRRDGLLYSVEQRHRSFLARARAAPARTLRYVQKTLHQTHTSPFQAALAQTQLSWLQLAPPSKLTTRNAVALEILWIMGLLVAWWWTR